MSAPPPPQPTNALAGEQPPPQGVEREVVVALAALLVSATAAMAPAALLLLLLRILRPFGIDRAAAWTAWKTTKAIPRPRGGARGIPRGQRPGPAARAAATAEQYYRAAYLLNASRRLQGAVDAGDDLASAVRREASYAAAHARAAENRALVASDVDFQAGVWGPILGWYTVLDGRTSADCRRANGKNFRAAERPRIGWPGSVHPHCRCRPGPPHATRALVGGGQLPADWARASEGPRRRARAGASV